MMSPAERRVAEEFCKGFSDKEVAESLCRSFHTIKTQKKAIYRKLGISKDVELMWWMVCEKVGIDFSLEEIRRYGIELLGNEDELSELRKRSSVYNPSGNE